MNTNNVNHPKHYNQYPIEVIDMMVAIWGKEKTATFCTMNAFKYRMRLGHKNDIQEDLAKEQWYLDKALQLMTIELNENEDLEFPKPYCKKCGEEIDSSYPIPYCTDCEIEMEKVDKPYPEFHPDHFKGTMPDCKQCGEELEVSSGLCPNCDTINPTRRKRR